MTFSDYHLSYAVILRLYYLNLVIDARRHVNKMCMAARVPLVESGTAGYLGQVQPLLKVRNLQPPGADPQYELSLLPIGQYGVF